MNPLPKFLDPLILPLCLFLLAHFVPGLESFHLPKATHVWRLRPLKIVLFLFLKPGFVLKVLKWMLNLKRKHIFDKQMLLFLLFCSLGWEYAPLCILSFLKYDISYDNRNLFKVWFKSIDRSFPVIVPQRRFITLCNNYRWLFVVSKL